MRVLQGRTGMTRGVWKKPIFSGSVWKGARDSVKAAYAKRIGLHGAVPK